MIRSLNIIVLFITIIGGILISRTIITNKNDYSFLEGKSNKVVLFIGDGMGENHIKVSSLFLEKEP